MDKSDLVRLVSSKTGLNEQMALTAVDLVIDFIKQKLPPEFASQLDGLLASDQGQSGASGVFDKVSGLFGKKES